MKRYTDKNITRREKRHARVRARVEGTASRPRLSVFRGNRAMEAQLVDDSKGKTLCAISSRAVKVARPVEGKTAKVAVAYQVGELLAKKAITQGITEAVFDRGGYRYHGRVAAVAEGARAGGLKF